MPARGRGRGQRLNISSNRLSAKAFASLNDRFTENTGSSANTISFRTTGRGRGRRDSIFTGGGDSIFTRGPRTRGIQKRNRGVAIRAISTFKRRFADPEASFVRIRRTAQSSLGRTRVARGGRGRGSGGLRGRGGARGGRGGRGGARGTRGGRGRGGRGRGGKVTANSLDDDLNDYMNKDATRAASTLDADLDDYFSKKPQQAAVQ